MDRQKENRAFNNVPFRARRFLDKPSKRNNSENNDGNNGDKDGKHDIKPSVDQRDSKNVFDLIPNRLKVHKKYLIKFIDKVKCTACASIFSNDLHNVLNHLTSQEHMRKSMMNPPKFAYQCEICPQNITSEKEWWRHLESKIHKSIFDKLGINRRSNILEYECLSCDLVMYGDKMSIMRHENLNGYKADKKNSNVATLKKEVKDMFATSEATTRLASKLMKDSSEAMRDDTLVQKCLDTLVTTVKPEYPDCKVYLFGSRVSGLGNSKSDVDVFIDIGNMYNGQINQDHKDQKEILKVLNKRLSDHPDTFTQMHPIPTARTPIIQFTYASEPQINCDLSFSHGLSVENTKFIRFCFDLQPIAKPAMLVLKDWAAVHYLKEEISSYAFCLMFIFYLQIHGYLLSVEQLRKLTNPNPPKIHYWKTIDYNQPLGELRKHIKKHNGPVFLLVKDFFKMYKNFDFGVELVCPLLGRTILINKFENDGKGLPNEMGEYLKQVAIDSDCEFNRSSSMCVQDPFDLGHNLTKKMPKDVKTMFVKLCDLSYNFMTKTG